MEGIISNLQRFSVDDGPGIRTTVFFQGCNLRCAWCHNPECIPGHPVLQYQASRCTGCGACAAACPTGAHVFSQGEHLLRWENCRHCGACAAACPAGALTLRGKRSSAQALLAELEKDRDYYETSGGGITCSGGEPLLQVDFLRELLSLCKQAGLHTAVDTAGNLPFSAFEAVLPVTDLFLYDIKAVTPALHRQATGVDNRQILENLPRLLSAGGRVLIRVPVVQEYNGTLEELAAIGDYLAPLGPLTVELLPYHDYGAGKYGTMGLPYAPLHHPDRAFFQSAAQLLQQRGLTALYHLPNQ